MSYYYNRNNDGSGAIFFVLLLPIIAIGYLWYWLGFAGMIIFLASLGLYMPAVSILGYEIGQYVLNINLVKWGSMIVFILISIYPLVIFAQLVVQYSKTFINFIILVPLFIGIGSTLLLLEAYFINNSVLNILIGTYTNLSIWLYTNIGNLIVNIVNWLLSST